MHSMLSSFQEDLSGRSPAMRAPVAPASAAELPCSPSSGAGDLGTLQHGRCQDSEAARQRVRHTGLEAYVGLLDTPTHGLGGRLNVGAAASTSHALMEHGQEQHDAVGRDQGATAGLHGPCAWAKDLSHAAHDVRDTPHGQLHAATKITRRGSGPDAAAQAVLPQPQASDLQSPAAATFPGYYAAMHFVASAMRQAACWDACRIRQHGALVLPSAGLLSLSDVVQQHELALERGYVAGGQISAASHGSGCSESHPVCVAASTQALAELGHYVLANMPAIQAFMLHPLPPTFGPHPPSAASGAAPGLPPSPAAASGHPGGGALPACPSSLKHSRSCRPAASAKHHAYGHSGAAPSTSHADEEVRFQVDAAAPASASAGGSLACNSPPMDPSCYTGSLQAPPTGAGINAPVGTDAAGYQGPVAAAAAASSTLPSAGVAAALGTSPSTTASLTSSLMSPPSLPGSPVGGRSLARPSAVPLPPSLLASPRASSSGAPTQMSAASSATLSLDSVVQGLEQGGGLCMYCGLPRPCQAPCPLAVAASVVQGLELRGFYSTGRFKVGRVSCFGAEVPFGLRSLCRTFSTLPP